MCCSSCPGGGCALTHCPLVATCAQTELAGYPPQSDKCMQREDLPYNSEHALWFSDDSSFTVTLTLQ